MASNSQDILNQGNVGSASQAKSAFWFFLGWGVFLSILYGLSRFDTGKRITYWTLWLMILLIMVIHINDFVGLFANAGILSPQQATIIEAPVPTSGSTKAQPKHRI